MSFRKVRGQFALPAQIISPPLVLCLLITACTSVPNQPINNKTTDVQPVVMEHTEVRKPVPKPMPVVSTDPIIADETESTSGEKDLWGRIQNGLAFPEYQSETVDQFKNQLLKRPDQLAQQIEQALPFLSYVVEQVEERGLPMELALLPFVESGYQLNQHAYSGAAGMWQLMPSTADHLNVSVDWWSDDRLNASESTNAALDYLEQLHQQYGDWVLALAAYNAGPGRVKRALQNSSLRPNGELDLNKIPLPRETINYIPRLYAYRDLIEHIHDYDILNSINMEFEPLQKIEIEQQIDFSVLASLTDLSEEEIRSFNPGYHRWATGPQGQHDFVLPENSAEQIRLGLSTLDENAFMPWQHYKIQPGDTLGHISRRYGITIGELKRINQLRNSRIVAGRTLKVPNINPDNKVFSASDTHQSIHIVSRGDSLWTIARRYGMSVRQLANLNQRSLTQPLFPGEQILLSP